MATLPVTHIGTFRSDRPLLTCINTATSAYDAASFRFAPCPENVMIVSSDEYSKMMQISSDPDAAARSLRAMYDSHGV